MVTCQKCQRTEDVVPQLAHCRTCLGDIMATTRPMDAHKVEEIQDGAWSLEGIQGESKARRVQVARDLENKLKPYQRQGVEFLWRNSFSDFNHTDEGDQSKIGGCILAHYMGLGKSLTTITLLHTALTNRAMVSTRTAKPLLHTVLLIAPANTLTNWVNEVEKWTKSLDHPLKVLNLGEIMAGSRPKNIQKWKREGGLLVMGDALFLKMAKDIVDAAQPDVLVVDEAHTMLKRSANKGFKTLREIKTKRRILLTGTPLQNNVTEYFRMVEYIRPGVIGVSSEAEFETSYRIPIEAGLPSDASNHDKLESLRLQLDLKNKLAPYVDRKSATVLRQQLPPIYDTLLYLHPSAIQKKLIKLEARARKDGGKSRNFFSMYAAIHPMLNHPACLKVIKRKRGKDLTWKSGDEAGDEWFVKAGLKQKEFDAMHDAKNSPKLIILAHILSHAIRNGEKTLIYSDDLNTLNVLEWFLSRVDWKKHVSSLAHTFAEKLGGWKLGKDYLRIDGSVDSGRRGWLVDRFNDESNIKAFLISSRAGGIGINLCAASVVVIMDNHFNPSISDQCISRAHRLGQNKPVYCFRLAIEGTMEAKIYARSVNKAGVAMQVVDGKFSERLFAADQLNDLHESSITATCDVCQKRRLLHPLQEPPEEDQKWECSMNEDKKYNSCKIPEQPELKRRDKEPKHIENNALLQHVRGVVNRRTRHSEIVHDYLPVEITHEADICCEEAIKRLEAEIGKKKQKYTRLQPFVKREEEQKDEQAMPIRLGKVDHPIVVDLSSDSDNETTSKRQRR